MNTLAGIIAWAIICAELLVKALWSIVKMLAVVALVPLCLPVLALMRLTARVHKTVTARTEDRTREARSLALAEAVKANPNADRSWVSRQMEGVLSG